jgi:hypothetical protein
VTQIPTYVLQTGDVFVGKYLTLYYQKLLVCLSVPVLGCYWGYCHTYNDERNYLHWINRTIAIYDVPIQGCDAGGYCAM